jgi:hypothetical protein
MRSETRIRSRLYAVYPRANQFGFGTVRMGVTMDDHGYRKARIWVYRARTIVATICQRADVTTGHLAETLRVAARAHEIDQEIGTGTI